MANQNNKTFYITTSIAYANASPHVGYAMELLQTDVLARCKRMSGVEVFLLTGTDEHGKKIAEAARKNNMEPRAYVDMMSNHFAVLYEALGISEYYFIRTSDQKKHMPVVVEMWQKMIESGDIYKGQYEGNYCVGCEAFLREAEMDGDKKCYIHKKQTQSVKEENYFFKFSKYAKKVEQLIASDVFQIIPEFRKKEALNLFSEEGIRDFSVSRPRESVEWGITVPGDEAQLIYVWVDALMNYVSGAGYGTDDFNARWPADVQVIGKDILRFHAMMWPAFLLACGFSEHELPKMLAVHGHISMEGQKMSKSLGNVVDPIELIKKYGKEAVRYYLLRDIPSDDDGDFSFARFESRYTADLQNGLGNLVSRVTTLGEKYQKDLEGIKVGDIFSDETQREVQEKHSMYKEHINSFQLHKALEQVWFFVDEANVLVNETKLWELAGKDMQKAKTVFQTLAENLYVIGALLAPFLPETAGYVLHALGIDESPSFISMEAKVVQFKKPKVSLFPKIEG